MTVQIAPELIGRLCRPGFTELPPEAARTICAACPARFPCLEFGIAEQARLAEFDAQDLAEVVYGGLTVTELRRIASYRQRTPQ